MIPVLYLVIPCYNEEAVLPETTKELSEKYHSLIQSQKISPESKIVFVNDGSKDKTWQLIQQCHEAHPEIFSGICLAHNSGHQNAILAGMLTVKDLCDAVITMDADLQDDIDTIDKMVEEFAKGFHVVYGVRSARKTDTFFKRVTAESFYKLMQMMGVELVYNHADFRLMSRRVLQELANYPEINLFLRGIVPTIGFSSTIVYYERHERFAGESKYPLKKMLHFAGDGITSFSVKPLKMIINIGFIMVVVSVAMFIWAFADKLKGNTVAGWSSTVCSIWLVGGMQLLCLGIIGEYIGKIYAEVKRRPRYIVAEFLNESGESEENTP